MSKRLCKLCGQRPAEVPDRDNLGRPIKAICRECHAQRLGGDLERVLDAAAIEKLRKRLESKDVAQ